jgi:hypothetical protein
MELGMKLLKMVPRERWGVFIQHAAIKVQG